MICTRMNRTECLVLCEEKNCEGSKAKERIRVVLLTVSHGGGIEDKKALSSPNEQLPPKSNIDTSPTVSPPTQLRSMEEKDEAKSKRLLTFSFCCHGHGTEDEEAAGLFLPSIHSSWRIGIAFLLLIIVRRTIIEQMFSYRRTCSIHLLPDFTRTFNSCMWPSDSRWLLRPVLLCTRFSARQLHPIKYGQHNNLLAIYL
jgi:hypothetical protein